jgi:4-amino-4-deoxychorismate lyase
MNLFFNGQIIKEQDLNFSADNRALNYGDGLFETMKFTQGKILYLQHHFERLQSGTKAFHLKLPPDFNIEFLEKNIVSLASANNLKEGRIKVLLWRKSGGLFSPESEETDYMILIKKWQSGPALKSNVIFCSERKNYSSLSRFKLLSSALYIMAGIEKKKKDADDVILLNHKDEVVECLNSNIFWKKDSVFYTPAITSGCIEGVMRKQIIAQLKALGISTEEGHYSKEELMSADFAFTSNIAGLSPISSIENIRLNPESDIFNKLIAFLAL